MRLWKGSAPFCLLARRFPRGFDPQGVSDWKSGREGVEGVNAVLTRTQRNRSLRKCDCDYVVEKPISSCVERDVFDEVDDKCES